MSLPDGLLLLDKPAGPTSHDAVDLVRRLAGGLRVGHTGTLDPFATGVLPLCIGRATRLARFLTAGRKAYTGAIRLGIATDTYDATGAVVATRPADDVTLSGARDAAARFLGLIDQRPPPFSAKKVGGKPLYELARAGRPVLAEPARVTVFRFDLLDFASGLVRFEAETSAGTYIRSLAHDLGERLGCGAHLVELRRTASGSMTEADAHPLSVVLERGMAGTLGDLITPLARMDLGLPTVKVSRRGIEAMRAGRPLTPRELLEGAEGALRPEGSGSVRVEDESGDLLGIAVPARDPAGEGILRPDVVLVPA
jgi:tRNA pseudouridine55 synthase